MIEDLTQFPPTGRHLIRYCGDAIEFRLRGSGLAAKGVKAFLSTNIGNAAIRRTEIVEQVENRITAGGQDWTNLPMQRLDEFTFALRLSLTEPGHFECKCCAVTEDDSEPQWVPGDNLHLNVEPAGCCASNSVYCAFVRQFNGNKNKPFSSLPEGIDKKELEKLDAHSYALIPPSGTFRDLIRELDHIIHTLKCRIIQLLPVNPTPTVYGRMGRFGSPYASLDFTGIDPALAEFDRKATPLDQFVELADAIHRRSAKLFLDIAINHTGWGSKLHETHPEWLVREPGGAIHSPGAWGVVWGDLTELDHSKLELWKYLADMFLVWCSRGVDGFRCDAGYLIPEPAWRYIVARVRNAYPDTVFLLEGLGGDPLVTQSLLNSGNLNWAYSELFQNYSREQVEGYLRYAWSESASNGLLIHYAETHDNNRLASVSARYSSMRTALSALASVSGAFGFANGVEWFASEKIDVHEASALNWGAEPNQNKLIARLNLLLALHPAFHAGALPELIDSASDCAVLFSRTDGDGAHGILAAVNLECTRPAMLEWDPSYTPFLKTGEGGVADLISGRRMTLTLSPRGKVIFVLPAGAFACLSVEREYLEMLDNAEKKKDLPLEHLSDQAAKALAFRLLAALNHSHILPDNLNCGEKLAGAMLNSPEKFLRILAGDPPRCGKVLWQWPEDARRVVMLPPDHVLFAAAPCPFRCRVSDAAGRILAAENALEDRSGRYFVLIPPLPAPEEHARKLRFEIRVYEPEKTVYATSALLQLPPDVSRAAVCYPREKIYGNTRVFLQANGSGAIIHQRMELEKLDSRYDAILLANLNPDYPEDRHIMWRRIRVWVIWHARRQEFKHEHLHSFRLAADGGGIWSYHVPVGSGMFIELDIKMEIAPHRNMVTITFHRKSCEGAGKRLPDSEFAKIIVRPDIEDRNFHYSTKAARGPEHYWPGQISAEHRAFEFRPAPDRALFIQASKGDFRRSDKWIYMNYQVNEAARGLDPNSDLYSPGEFHAWLSGDETLFLTGQVLTPSDPEKAAVPRVQEGAFDGADDSVEAVALCSLRAFIVRREGLKTVIAGYPWFLDWGRDTLIAARGLAVVPEFREDVRKILLRFALFEENGTIPNMISGSDAGNRDTSDAPLWLFTAAADLCRAEGSADFLQTKVRAGRTFLQVLEKLAEGILKGTPNGIKCDPESLLVFSPAHFTWMDTNYPAATPREGYPVEIQALWLAALSFLAGNVKGEKRSAKWSATADQVRASILRFFPLKNASYLSDCLHAPAGTPASAAIPDDHLRPNQLLAVTLGAVRDRAMCEGILDACASLLVPGAIRSLADRAPEFRLPVTGANGALLNDPARPYRGRYEGDEDTRRKVAYHNGTAWTWLFPSFAEACFLTDRVFGKAAAKSYLASMILLMDGGCITQLPEILDGDSPHTLRGCDAQAWGMSEFYRVWKLLHS